MRSAALRPRTSVNHPSRSSGDHSRPIASPAPNVHSVDDAPDAV